MQIYKNLMQYARTFYGIRWFQKGSFVDDDDDDDDDIEMAL
jgi:hypothetical protein